MMRRVMLFGVLLIGMVTSACSLGGTDAEPQTVGTAIPTAQIETFPPNEAVPTEGDATPTTNLVPTTIPVATQAPQNTSQTGDIAPVGERGTATNTSETPTNDTLTATPDVVFPTVFQEQYPVNVSAGGTLIVNYTTNFTDSSSRLYILVRDPTNAEVARIYITESTQDNAEIAVTVSGIHTILVAPENLFGNYSVTYALR